MRKIALAIHSLQAGGMERVMAELVHYFATKKDIELHLILYGITREIFYPIPENVIVHKPGFTFDNRYRTWNTLKTLLFIRGTVLKIKPETVLSFGEFWNNLVLLSTLGLGIPIYVSDRSQPDKSLGWLHDELRKWLYPRATGVIAQTEKAKAIFRSYYSHQNIQVIGNPIRKIDAESRGIERKKQVLMVGRLINTKHQDMLIELFVRINKPGWELVIVGYDHLKQKHMDRLRQLVIDLKAEDRVTLAGKQSDVEKFYLSSQIFAFTSSSEGFPNVIGEAMAAGLPVVAFDCVAGPSDMIEHGKTGYLIPLFDYDQFQEKLEYLMDHADLREAFGLAGKRSIKKFAPEVIASQFEKVILEPAAKP